MLRQHWRNFHNYFDYILVCAHLAKDEMNKKSNEFLFFALSPSLTFLTSALNMSFISAERFIVWNVAGGSFSYKLYEKIFWKINY